VEEKRYEGALANAQPKIFSRNALASGFRADYRKNQWANGQRLRDELAVATSGERNTATDRRGFV
jgi:hypothetical protein